MQRLGSVNASFMVEIWVKMVSDEAKLTKLVVLSELVLTKYGGILAQT